jgi:hypothetical protein
MQYTETEQFKNVAVFQGTGAVGARTGGIIGDGNFTPTGGGDGAGKGDGEGDAGHQTPVPGGKTVPGGAALTHA